MSVVLVEASPVEAAGFNNKSHDMSLRRIAVIVAGTLLIGLVLLLPAAARPLAAIKTDGTLRVGMTGDYAPYSVRGPDGQFSGADVTMAAELARSLGVVLVIVPTRGRRCRPISRRIVSISPWAA